MKVMERKTPEGHRIAWSTADYKWDIDFDEGKEAWFVEPDSFYQINLQESQFPLFPNSNHAKRWVEQMYYGGIKQKWKKQYEINWYFIKGTPIWISGNRQNWSLQTDRSCKWFGKWIDEHKQYVYAPLCHPGIHKSKRELLAQFLEVSQKYPNQNLNQILQKFYG